MAPDHMTPRRRRHVAAPRADRGNPVALGKDLSHGHCLDRLRLAALTPYEEAAAGSSI
jgi:hypothetical protein